MCYPNASAWATDATEPQIALTKLGCRRAGQALDLGKVVDKETVGCEEIWRHAADLRATDAFRRIGPPLRRLQPRTIADWVRSWLAAAARRYERVRLCVSNRYDSEPAVLELL